MLWPRNRMGLFAGNFYSSRPTNLLLALHARVPGHSWIHNSRYRPRSAPTLLFFENGTIPEHPLALNPKGEESVSLGRGSAPYINITAEVLQDVVANISCVDDGVGCVEEVNGSQTLNVAGEEDAEQHNWLFLLLGLLVVAGGLGNVLVCLAICLERKLQNVTNYFLLSLAVADLLVCVAVMPFGILDGFLGYWPFDWHVCSVWVSCDVLSCSSSIMHMCFISLGRYLGISNPLETRVTSKKIVMLKIVLVWLVSMVITSPITVLAMIDPANIEPAPRSCAINNRFFFVFGSMFAFYVPMVIMIVTYVLTVRLLQRKAKFLAQKPSRRVPFIRRGRRSSPDSPESSNRNGHVQNQNPQLCGRCNRCQTETLCDTRGLLHSGRRDSGDALVGVRLGRQSQRYQSYKTPHTTGMVRSMGTNQVMNEQKATKVLGIVFFSFVVCWTPFFILNILFTVKDASAFPSYLATFFLWLGYVSSTINPIIYTVFNKTFKRAFWKLLTCRCHFSRHISLHSTNDLATWAFRSANHYATKSGSPPDLYQESMC